MSMELMDEHEQSEHVRAWLRDNGASIVGGIALGIGAIIGWNWWGSVQADRQVDAAAQYASLVAAAERNDRDGAEAIAKSLNQSFDDSAYSVMGAFVWSDLQIQAGETQAAAETLRGAAERAEEPALQNLVKARLARTLLAADQAEAALNTLNEVSADAPPTVLELRGDALVKLGRTDEAVSAYQKAFASYEETLPTRRLLEMKLLDLGAKPDDVDA